MASAWSSLIVRSPRRWSLTPASGRDSVDVESSTVVALMRYSEGAPLVVDEAVRTVLEAGGVFALDDVDHASHPAIAHPADGSRGWRDWPTLPNHARICAVPAFVARIVDGYLLVEGFEGDQHRLDDIDVEIFSAFTQPSPVNIHDAAITVEAIDAALPAAVRGRLAADELGCRIRRIAAAGRLILVSGFETTEQPRTLRRLLGGYRRRSAALLTRRKQPAVTGGDAVPADIPEPVSVLDEGDGQFGRPARYLTSPRPDVMRDDLVPVYAVFQVSSGPTLALGMLTSAARHYEGGCLSEWFEIRRPEDAATMLADLRQRTGPAVLLCSNYVWSLEHNLELARAAKAICPDLLVIHGGPSAPKYEADAEQFMVHHAAIADILVRGEGEVTLARVLQALGPGLPTWELSRLEAISGVTFRAGDGGIVRTPDQERIGDLDALPSPYLTGEFDHLHPSAWNTCVTLESNRGCPYGCTFCDWGSATLSRVRNFAMDRVVKELEWAARRGIESWLLADANFGIKARDVEIADALAQMKRTYGVPKFLGFNVAKNTTTHLADIVDRLISERIAPECSLALQSRDPETLRAVRRSNINTDQYLQLAATFRRKGLPLVADLMEGLPGQTLSSFVSDLDFLVEHEVAARVWPTQLLPNSPMNDPRYRAEYQIVGDERNLVASTASCGPADREVMERIRLAGTITEQFGLLRHVLRYLLWDHGIKPSRVWRTLLSAADDASGAYPLVGWTLRYFDLFSIPPLGWRSFYGEVRSLIEAEFDVKHAPCLDAVLRLQHALMPDYGRTFPATVQLEHDYVAYYRDATEELWRSGRAGRPPRPLASYPPAEFTVFGDPMNMCSGQMRPLPKARNPEDFGSLWQTGQFELDSPLVRAFPEVAAKGTFTGFANQAPQDLEAWMAASLRSTKRIPVRGRHEGRQPPSAERSSGPADSVESTGS